MKSYVIHLIRNAPCEGNLEGRYIGRTESPLAMQSIQELVGLKKEFIYPDVYKRQNQRHHKVLAV